MVGRRRDRSIDVSPSATSPGCTTRRTRRAVPIPAANRGPASADGTRSRASPSQETSGIYGSRRASTVFATLSTDNMTARQRKEMEQTLYNLGSR